MSTKRFSPFITLLIALSLILAACQPEIVEVVVVETVEVEVEKEVFIEVTPTAVPVGEDEVVTVTWWGTERGRDTAAARDLHYQLARAFEESHPNIKVAVSLFPSRGFSDRVLTAIAGGEGPDAWYHYFATDIANQGFLEDLTPYLEASGINPGERWFPIAQQRSVYEGRYYGIPRDATASVTVYNKDLFDDAGVPYPEAGWTIADFREKAIALTDADNDIYGVGAIIGSPGCFQWSSFSFNMGADFVSPDGRYVAGYMDTPEALAAWQYCLDLTAVDKVTAPAAMQEQFGELVFISGQVAMQNISTWELAPINEQADFEWAVIEPPRFDEDTPSIAWTDSYVFSMWSGSPHKQRAWQFLEWLTGPEAAQIMAESGVWAPAVPEVWENMGWDTDPVLGVFWTELQKETRVPNYLRTQFYWDCVGDIFYDVWSNYVELGDTDLEGFLLPAVEDAQMCLDDNFAAVED